MKRLILKICEKYSDELLRIGVGGCDFVIL